MWYGGKKRERMKMIDCIVHDNKWEIDTDFKKTQRGEMAEQVQEKRKTKEQE